ncbi:MAG: hypothetical protein KF773_20800, partial [Deltaproteobacteria bacterium]|nr:hypothetical protein [Deltaproteobacteria bacterium]
NVSLVRFLGLEPEHMGDCMDAKDLYFGALKQFRDRNAPVLPQVQLQYGANERWLAREFTLAMNCHLAGSWNPQRMQRFADCEFRYADITVWEGDTPLALYEVKALYSDMSTEMIRGIVEKASRQLSDHHAIEVDRRLGLFFAVYYEKGKSETCGVHANAFATRVRDAVRTCFTSDHQIRMTELSPLSEIDYGPLEADPWHTQSWVTWGQLA